MNIMIKMLNELPFSNDELSDLISTAQFRYKVFEIPKKKEGRFRVIAQPTPEIKLIQRWLLKRVLSKLPIHRSATAYRSGLSISDHAAKHAKNRFLLKMDFKNFFPSISVDDVRRHLVEVGKMTIEDAKVISLLVCWRDKSTGNLCLSIGAPSSPALSNSILYSFDKKVIQICQGYKVRYSRYADDLAFSTNKEEVLSELMKEIHYLCSEIEYPKLEINQEKTVSTSRGFRRVLVGLVLTPEGNISIGRENKRRLRSELYRFSKGLLKEKNIATLRGELAFVWSVEKSFINTLLRQQGREVFIKLDLPFSLAEK